MKCPYGCRPIAKHRKIVWVLDMRDRSGVRYQEAICPVCHGHGWIPFWSEAERAGIKEMGNWMRGFISDEETRALLGQTIHAYIWAARAKKEPSCEK